MHCYNVEDEASDAPLLTRHARYNLHPGSTRGELSVDEGLRLVAESVNWALERTKGVTVVLENTAGGGYTIGRDFKELGKIIEMVKDKSRIGVCLGRCYSLKNYTSVESHEEIPSILRRID